ncbi:MAG: Zn-ribbon domain-containing OB-fold protein [Syntrophales bacterium]
MSTDNKRGELLQINFAQPMPYEWSIGLYGSRFFQEIKESRRFVGIKCNGCGNVYVPPRRVCGPCFRELTELVTLSDAGVITAFSVVNYPFIDPNTGSQRPIPYTYGYIRIDGANNIFSHIINETDLNKIKVGMKVRAVFKNREDMEGNIQDIRHFEIVG